MEHPCLEDLLFAKCVEKKASLPTLEITLRQNIWKEYQFRATSAREHAFPGIH